MSLYMVLQNKLGSFELIILPVLVPIVSGGIGLITLPYIRKITQAIGNVIHSFRLKSVVNVYTY